MTPFLRARLVLALGALIAGCTTLVGVEDEYGPRHTTDVRASGGTQSATGGSAGGSATGGGSGGSIEAGAATGGGGVGGGLSCGSDLKLCGGECRMPAPSIGCASQGCEPCPGAANAEPVCNGDQCAQQCVSGFQWNGADCVASGGGGSGGVGGVSGVGGTGGSGGGVSGSGGSSTGGASTCSPLACAPNQPCAACPPCPIAPFSNCCLPGGKCGGMWVTGCFPCGP